MCFSDKKYNEYRSPLTTYETPNLPSYGWWYYCTKCTLPTYHEDRICNTCKQIERKRRRRMNV